MSSYDNYHSYTPIEYSPTKSLPSSPVTTPSRAALIRPNFLRGSPIKFPLSTPLSTPEKTRLKNVDFDDFEETEDKRSPIWAVISRISLWILWGLLTASAIYLYLPLLSLAYSRSILYVESAGLGVSRWSNQLKSLYRFGLALNTLSAGFSIGYFILSRLKFPSSPWQTSIDHPRRLIVNWIMFTIFIVGFPVACTVIPFILGRSGKFNSQYQNWNTACSDSRFNSMLHIKYIATIGYSYSINIYARDLGGKYHYLGLLPSSAPTDNNVNISTPNFILFPTTNPITPDAAAGQRMLHLTNGTTQLISSLRLNATKNGGQSIEAKCTTSPNQPNNLTSCVNGFLTSSEQILKGDEGPNPLLRTVGSQTKTLEIMFDINPLKTDSTNATFLRGFTGSWPNASTSFMTGNVAAQVGPAGVLEEFNSDGVSVGEGVQVVNSPWPGCDGLKVCGTSGLNAMIVSGWIWENLDKWMWYSSGECEPY